MVVVPAAGIADWTSRGVSKEAFGVPDSCGRDTDAWVGRTTSLDAPGGDGLVAATVDAGGVVGPDVEDAPGFTARYSKPCNAPLGCSAFVIAGGGGSGSRP